MAYRDLVVVLPGITGSVLEKHGRVVWDFSLAAGWEVLRSRGEAIDALALDGDDPEAADLGDGVRATRLLHRAHALPGLHKNIGYGPLVRALRERLEAEVVEFPYDWRRDNRASAHALRRLVHERLPAWREASGATDAGVVLVAHSMGGLVSRHYLECLGGYEHCRALVTFGTPFRGSPHALEFLANGYKKLFLDLSAAVRSFPSVHQLLPRYPMLDVDGTLMRIAEAAEVPGVDRGLARDAIAFHTAIDAGVKERAGADGYLLQPVVGMRQPTMQSARLADGACVVGRDVPAGWPSELGDGDGTVPRVSATPIELSTELRDTFFAERHAALQANANVLESICLMLKQLPLLAAIDRVRGSAPAPARGQAPAVALQLDDAYRADEPVVVRADVANYVEPVTTITAQLEPLDRRETSRALDLRWDGDGYEAVVEDLPPGAYAITVSPGPAFPAPAPAIRDLFEVVA
jgi:Lecithin:cholesterol acyltransferase